jgi:hypothetical protein
MILQASEESVPEPADRADVHRAHQEVVEAAVHVGGAAVQG